MNKKIKKTMCSAVQSLGRITGRKLRDQNATDSMGWDLGRGGGNQTDIKTKQMIKMKV